MNITKKITKRIQPVRTAINVTQTWPKLIAAKFKITNSRRKFPEKNEH